MRSCYLQKMKVARDQQAEEISQFPLPPQKKCSFALKYRKEVHESKTEL